MAGATDEILAGITPEREAAMAELDRIMQAEIQEAVTRLDASIAQAVVDIDGALTACRGPAVRTTASTRRDRGRCGGSAHTSASPEVRLRESRIKSARTGNCERKGADRRPVNRTRTELERERDAGQTAEAILVRRARAGETAAFGELVSIYMQRCYYAALGMVGSPQDAEDLSQEAFVRAFKARARLDPERPFYPWLYQILSRLCYNFTRDTSSRRRKLERAGGWLVAEARVRASVDDPERVRATEELRDRLESAIRELPLAQREVFVLKEFEGLKYREIAELLDVPIGTVMSRLYAARQRLAARLEGLE